jgi:hypothetical protein
VEQKTVEGYADKVAERYASAGIGQQRLDQPRPLRRWSRLTVLESGLTRGRIVRRNDSRLTREVFMPTSVKDFFDKKVPEVLRTQPDKAKEVAAIYLCPDLGRGRRDLDRRLRASPPTREGRGWPPPSAHIEASDSDFRSMIDGGMPVAMQLFFGGKIKSPATPTSPPASPSPPDGRGN